MTHYSEGEANGGTLRANKEEQGDPLQKKASKGKHSGRETGFIVDPLLVILLANFFQGRFIDSRFQKQAASPVLPPK